MVEQLWELGSDVEISKLIIYARYAVLLTLRAL